MNLEASGGFWKIPEDSGHLGKVGGGCKQEPRSFLEPPGWLILKILLQGATPELAEWPWTMTLFSP